MIPGLPKGTQMITQIAQRNHLIAKKCPAGPSESGARSSESLVRTFQQAPKAPAPLQTATPNRAKIAQTTLKKGE